MHDAFGKSFFTFLLLVGDERADGLAALLHSPRHLGESQHAVQHVLEEKLLRLARVPVQLRAWDEA